MMCMNFATIQMFFADIPVRGVEPLGGMPEGWRLLTGILVYIAAIASLMIYLWWKLPRHRPPGDGEKRRDADGDGATQEREGAKGGGGTDETGPPEQNANTHNKEDVTER